MPTINGRACVANGRNLLTGTSSELKTMQLTNSYNVGPQATNGDFKIKVVKGQTYTYRAWLDNTQGTDKAFVNIRLLPMTEGAKNVSLADGVPIAKGETGYSTAVFTIPEDGYIKPIPFAYGTQVTAFVGWKEEKLEKGTTATPLTPAPVEKVFSDGRQVYGRNLLTGTSSELKTKQLTNGWNVGPQATNGDFKIKVVKGQTYTYRAWLDNTPGTDQAFVNVRLLPMTDGATNVSLGDGVRINKGEAGYSTLAITIPEDGFLRLTPFGYGTPVTAFAGWKEEKLEKGSVSTPWTPAPEDVM